LDSLINAQELGKYPDRLAAVKRVEELIEREMRLTVRDWEVYVTANNVSR
jgi:hypothetical protein